MSEEEVVDMEEQPPTSEELSDVYKRFFDFPYESLHRQQSCCMLSCKVMTHD